jgi:hypothetical protein
MRKQHKDGESFTDDRAWHYDVPNDDDTYESKLAWQKKIQRMWLEAADKPPDALRAIPREQPEKWWTLPDALPPHVARARLKKLMGG